MYLKMQNRECGKTAQCEELEQRSSEESNSEEMERVSEYGRKCMKQLLNTASLSLKLSINEKELFLVFSFFR